MKKYLLLLSLLLTQLTAMAYDFYVDGIYYMKMPNSEVAVTSRTGENSLNSYYGDIVIPSEITVDGNVYNVTAIDNFAFSECSGLTSVKIPNSITSIGYKAFYDCTRLTSIEIPSSVTILSYSVFANCTELATAPIHDRITDIEENAFKNCTRLHSVTIPLSVKRIGFGAFSGCTSLSSLVIADSYNAQEKLYSTVAFTDCPISALYLGRGMGNYGYNDDAYDFVKKDYLKHLTIGYGIKTTRIQIASAKLRNIFVILHLLFESAIAQITFFLLNKVNFG